MCQHPASTLETWVLTHPLPGWHSVETPREQGLFCRSVCPDNPPTSDVTNWTPSRNLCHYQRIQFSHKGKLLNSTYLVLHLYSQGRVINALEGVFHRVWPCEMTQEELLYTPFPLFLHLLWKIGDGVYRAYSCYIREEMEYIEFCYILHLLSFCLISSLFVLKKILGRKKKFPSVTVHRHSMIWNSLFETFLLICRSTFGLSLLVWIEFPPNHWLSLTVGLAIKTFQLHCMNEIRCPRQSRMRGSICLRRTTIGPPWCFCVLISWIRGLMTQGTGSSRFLCQTTGA